MTTRYIWFVGQYGNHGRWHKCTVDSFGVWRCGGMYMPEPHWKYIQDEEDDS